MILTSGMQSQIRSRPIVSLTLAFFLVIGVWSILTPLFAGPDEPANYIKGAAIIRGVLVGEDVEPTSALSYWSTRVEIPYEYGVAMQVPWCFVPMPNTPACNRPMESLTPEEKPITNMGRYPPIGFVTTGLGSLIGPNDLSVRCGRLLNSLLGSLLLAIGCTFLTASRRSAIAILAATTPGVLFLSSVNSPSGIEIAASICLWSAMYSVFTSHETSILTKSGFAFSGSLVILVRPVGSIIYLITLAISVIAYQKSSNWKSKIRDLLLPITIHLLLILTSAVWYFKIYNFHLAQSIVDQQTLPSLLDIVEQSINDLSVKIGESIGNYGWLDTPSPTFVVWFFIALVAIIIARNWQILANRNRVALIIITLFVPIFMILLNLNYQNLLAAYGVQGRHLTPLIVGIPIIGGALWNPKDATLRIVLIGWTLSVFTCGAFALRRYSVGVQPLNFRTMFTQPVWQPMLGVAGTLCALAVALIVFGTIFYTVATKELN